MIRSFEEQVRKHGKKAAICDPVSCRNVTYSELDESARRVAAKLISEGFGKGDVAMILAARGIGFIEAMLGVLMAGGTYVPLSDHYPAERVAYIREDCRAKLMINDGYIESALKHESIAAPVETAPEDIALIAYTSGSTGKPKGILHDHRSLAASVHSYHVYSAMESKDVYAINAPLYFIVHVTDVFGPLTLGMTAWLVPEALRGDPDGLASFIDAHGVTGVFISPKVMRFFTKKGKSLRFVQTGSERLAGIAPKGFRLVNTYGMTETGRPVTTMEVDRAYDNTPVGKPIGDVRVYLLNEQGENADEGEICVSGCMGRGYLNLPEQTAKTFTPNPFRAEDGFETLIHTGDLGRRLPDGNILYINRKDWMIKINGQRVEPGEIEAGLRALDGIKDAAVKDFTDAFGDVYLAAYYLADEEKSEAELKNLLSKHFPAYMIPARFVRLDRFPVNANGKLDRFALPKPAFSYDAEEEVPTENDGQRTILHSLAATVGHGRFDITTPFEEAGLNSIGAIRLTQALSEAFGVPVSIADIHAHPNVKELEAYLVTQKPLTDHALRDAYPLTQTQMGVLAESLAEPDSTDYNVPLLLKLSDKVDVQRLKTAVEQAISAHPYLLLRLFTDEEGRWMAQRDGGAVPTVEVVEAEALPEKLILPFQMAGERLYRARIYVTPAGRYLFTDFHHILFDGTSMVILIQDIDAAYAGKALDPERYTGFEAALDEEERRGTDKLQEDRDYYGALLSEADTISLPVGDAPVGQDSSGRMHRESRLNVAAIREYCQQNKVTENAFFNAVFAFVLSRCSHTEDVLYTTIYNGRNDSRLARCAAMLVKTLPVALKVQGDEAIAEFIAAAGKQLMASMSHDLYSFAEISREHDLRADLMLAYQGDTFQFNSIGGEPAQQIVKEQIQVQRPLSVDIFVRGARIDFEMEFDGGRYSEAFMAGLADAMEKTASEFLQKAFIREVSMLSDEARAQIERFNDTDAPVELKAVHRLFEEQAGLHPKRTAVIAAGERLTYAQLNDRANRIANALIQRGLKLGETVGMLLPRITDAVAVEYGVMKAGGAFLPMLPDYPDERVEYCMTDSGSRFVITTDDLIEEKGGLFDGKAYQALSVQALLAEGDAETPQVDVGPDETAYCIYTSGSTGKPKGVMITHGNLCNFVNANEKNEECWHYVSHGRTALSVASLSFDFSLMEIHLPLCNGLTLCMATEEEVQNPLLLAELIEKNKVEVIAGTPSFLSGILDIPETAHAVRNVKMYDLGAEAFPPALYAKIREASPEAVIVNGYGPTEATISCISKVIDGTDNITIGRPAANVKAWVCDHCLNILPPEAKGELVIGGLGVGRGYVNLPEKTAEAFVTLEGGRAYRTGDIVRLNGDLELEFFGRQDNQVKLRGLRIELDEIENVMNTYPGVTRSVVLVREPEGGDPFLCGYFTAGEPVDAGDLKAHISKRLARYMVPAAFVQLEVFPLTANGKVDKKALPMPERQQEALTPPQNETQQRIFDLAAEVMGHSEFGIETDLYEAGLSSLGAIRLNVLLSKAFDRPLSIRDLKDNPTVIALAGIVSEGASQESYEIMPDYPLTQTQMGILVETLTHPDTVIYNIPSLYKLADSVDTDKLARAVETAIQAHPYLKATLFMTEAQEYRAKRNDAVAPLVEIVRVPTLPKDMVKPFDLLSEPLYRARIYVTKREKYLFLEFHHIVYDGTSDAIFMEDVNAAYDGQTLEAERFTGFEAALEEARLRETEAYDRAKAYYDELLGGADHDMLPDGDELAAGGTETTSANLAQGSKLSVSAVQAFCRSKGLTENALFNAAFAYVLAKFCGRQEALYTTVYNGRSDSRLNRSVTMLVKTFPVLYAVDGSQSVQDFVKALESQLTESMANDLYSFGEIAREYHVSADVLFVYQGEIDTETQIAGETAQLVPLASDEAKAPLQLEVYAAGGEYSYHCEYHSSRFSETFIRAFIACVDQAAAELLIRKRVEEVDLLTKEAEALMDRLNSTDKPRPETDVVSMFRQAAAQYPDQPAVLFREETLTYGQVDDVSERIAAYLRAQGIGRGKVVSVLIPRGTCMATASLGVLKAGAAYQPLDPSYPEDRLNFMMRDASCALLIAEEELLPKASEYQGPVLLTKDIPSLPQGQALSDHPSPEDAFILLYTSGTTGLPKGVVLEHRNLVNFCYWYREQHDLNVQSRVAAYASYGFDACMMDLYPALTTGAAVVIIPEEDRLDLAAIQRRFDEAQVTHSIMTTQVARQFAQYYTPGSLRHLFAGGETMAPLYVDKGFTFHNAYGPTECTILCSIFAVDRLYTRVPIGKAVDNVKFYVVDDQLRRLPPFVPGELLLAGSGVGRGYLNRPEQTEKAFIANPFNTEERYTRAYRTGDIVRLLPDGNLDFIGRNDAQVKVRGFRVELPEIEAVIRDYPGVSDATVQAFDAPSGGKFIAAYVVGQGTIDIHALADFVGARKPPYMVPEVIMQIDAIPLNQNQKVNKKALPVPQRQEAEVIAPKTEAQKRIFDCVAETIGHRDFGITTNLYEAGLSSIGSIRLSVLLAQAFGVPVKTADLKDNDTVVKLETYLSGAKTEAFEILSDYGITKTQEGIFVESIARPQSTIYNIPILLEISREIDLEKLKQAIVDAVNAHPYIMTSFFMDEEGEIRQKRAEQAFDASSIETIQADSLKSIEKDLVKPFDLLNDRLFRIKLIDAGQRYLYIEMHHIISDGTSVNILLEDISKAYLGEKPEAETFSGYEAVLEEERMRAEPGYEQAKAYYAALLKDADTESLPAGDREEGQAEQPGAATYLSQALTLEAVNAFCEQGKVSKNAFFTGVFGFVLSDRTHLDAPVFATIYNGRNDSRLTRTITMLVKTFPVVCRTDDKALSPTEYVARTGQQLLDSMANDVYSFAEISREYSVNADVMFSYEGEDFVFDSLCGKPAKLIDLSLDQVKAPMDAGVMVADGKVCWTMEYDAGRYSREYVEGFLKALDAAAGGFIRQAHLEDISMDDVMKNDSVEIPEKAKTGRNSSMDDPRRTINDTAYKEPFVSVVERFKQQVELHPGKTAVICRHEQLTYKKLYDEANKLADAISAEGVGREDIVAVMLPRCVQVYVCRQGILNAGAAFLCIAPDYPDDRVAFILKDSGAKLLITDAETLKTRKAFLETLSVSVVTPEELAEEGTAKESKTVIYQNDLCYCIYTSGSTGKPKGVMIEHGNLANFVSANPKNAETLGYTERARVSLSLAAMTFDVSIMEQFIPLTNGMTAVIATEEEIHDLSALAKLMIRNKVDVVTTTPSFVSAMLEVDEMRVALANVASYDLGAEAFLPGLCDGIKAVNPNAHIMNGYGPTEATISCTMKVIEEEGVITIGRPNANVFVYIIDENGNELPAGEIGELLICGKGVGRGYINLPEKTAEAFITFNGVRGYRSGDLARINEDGEIEFHGRMDNQVKLRGFRVELGEIEEVLCSHPAVQLAACRAIDNKYLVAYYTASKPLPPEELKAYAASKLTEYMVPNVLMQMDSLPLTESKKIDRKALPTPDLSDLQGDYAAPENEMQEKLCGIFAKVLKLERVGIDDDFFEIGGTSLAASRVAVMCVNEKIPVVYADIFKEHTVRKLTEGLTVPENGGSDQNVFEDYDYHAIDAMLAQCDLAHVDRVYSEGVGDVLLTGATGFLGMHVLHEFLEHHDGRIYCLVRKGKFASPEERLKGIYHYYFSHTGERYIGERLFCIDGDITDKDVVDALDQVPFNTLINCAACVKHFAAGDVLHKINVEGVENLIALCMKTGKRLIQISTVSVGGEMNAQASQPVPKIRETDLYFGQIMENEYVRSKFLAERAVLEAASKGCNAKVIRVGNLMSRDADGEFQINFISNAFVRTLRGYKAVRAFPEELMREEVEFSPVDSTAAAVLKLAGTARDFHLFHAINNHKITMGDVIYAMREYGYPIRVIPNKQFEEVVNAYLKKHEGSQAVSGLIAYADRNGSERVQVDYENDFTTEALFRLGYKWPISGDEYLRLSIAALDSLNFFNVE